MSILLNNLSLRYGRRVLLEQVSATFPQATLTALIGRNGTGKSTLLRAIAGLGPAEGEVELCGRRIASLTARERATTLAVVTTERIRIANLTCEEVVAFGRAPYTDWIGNIQAEDRTVVERSLHLVGLDGFARKTMDRMSDGECQRVMIARALAQDTPVILLDEPTAFLDMPNRYELCTLLAELAHGQDKCILFSTHELDIALNLCDDIALIAPPHLYLQTVEQTVRSGHLERLFASANVTFDPATRSVIVKR